MWQNDANADIVRPDRETCNVNGLEPAEECFIEFPGSVHDARRVSRIYVPCGTRNFYSEAQLSTAFFTSSGN